MRILVVDDSATMRRIVANTLYRLGVTDVVEAEDGAEALERFAGSVQPVQLVITDWNMPRMTGTELARALRGRGEAVPVLMVTSRSGRGDVAEALEAGVTDYIVKPFSEAQLKEKLDALLAETIAAL